VTQKVKFSTLGGNQLISPRSISVSGPHTAGRLLIWAAAMTVACAIAGLSVPVAASADTATTRTASDRQLSQEMSAPAQVRGDSPKQEAGHLRWLDSTTVRAFAMTGPVVFAVSANNGVPFIFDPNSTPIHWQNLRRVPLSQGGFVTNITVTEAANSTPGSAKLLIIARTSDSNFFFTTCNVQNVLPQAPALLPCTPWQRLPA
jgi:hypothetical protein